MLENLKNEWNKWKFIFYTVLVLCLVGLGFIVGRKSVKIPEPGEHTEYITLPPIHDSIPKPVPYYVEAPIDTAKIIEQCVKDGLFQELWPDKPVDPVNADTTAIMIDWATKRKYSETIFDVDTLGKCVVDAEVQYNRLKMVGYEFTPVQKVTTNTIYKENLFSPFVGVNGACALDGSRNFLLGINGGAYFKDKYGVSVQYQHSVYDKTSYLGGGFSVKF